MTEQSSRFAAESETEPSQDPEAGQDSVDSEGGAETAPRPTGGIRFSLRTLIALMLVIGGITGWFGWRWQQQQYQRKLVEPLQLAGAKIEISKGDVVRVAISDPSEPLTAAALAPLAKLPRLKRLVLIDVSPDAAMLAQIGELESLEELLIMRADLSAVDLSSLAKLSKLRVLWLTEAKLRDASLEPIGQIPSLRELNLNDNRLSDNGLLYLAELVELQRLFIANTSITDNGIDLVRQTLVNVKIQREAFLGYEP